MDDFSGDHSDFSGFQRPNRIPQNPYFGVGPCTKYPGWSAGEVADTALVQRSHRAKVSVERIQKLLRLHREVLEIPEDYVVAITPGSTTGAMDMALWNLLGSVPLTVVSWDVFGGIWAEEVKNQLGLEMDHRCRPSVGVLPSFDHIPLHHDIIYTLNGSTSGMNMPHVDWLSSCHEGLVFCDAVSGIFSMEVPWERVDVVTFSWQKGLGGEASHGMLVLSPKALQRLNEKTPRWPIPRILGIPRSEKAQKEFFEGMTVNTPSMWCVEDAIKALEWCEKQGGLPALVSRSQQNLLEVERWVAEHPFKFLAKDPKTRSSTTICVIPSDESFSQATSQEQWRIIQEISVLLEKENVAYDIKGHAHEVPCFRLWGGAMMDPESLRCCLDWIYWAHKIVTHS